jgi:beta-N-acetylhexosaminidase
VRDLKSRISASGAGDVGAILRRMTLPEKVGQLFVSAVPGTAADQGGAQLVRRYHLGGVIYFALNVHTASQVAGLSNGLERAAMAQSPAVPLTIGTDQEGGTVSRLEGILTSFPSQMAAGATRDPALVRAAARVTGTQLRALGINLDYAPVADVNTNPANPVIGTRSFGSDPVLVSGMTSAAISGLHSAGLAAAAKHFPGHGDTDVDSHTGLPIIHRDLRQWRRIDEPPFRAAIGSDVDMIMSAHIIVPALDGSGNPATLSGKIITGLLRKSLGFRGVVTTDSLEMAGVHQRYNNAQIAVHAVLAGCDELLMPDSLATAYDAVLAAVRRGQIPVARLDQSVTRILTLKADRGILRNPYVNAAAASGRVATAAGAAAARLMADRSVTVVKNSRRTLPLRRGTPVYVAGPDAAALGAALSANGMRRITSPGAARAIVVTTTDAAADPAQRSLVRRLVAAGPPVIVVATGKPYDLGLFSGSAAVATYSDSAVSIAAAAGVLGGAIHPSGRLPVSIPGAAGHTAYEFGTGLHY